MRFKFISIFLQFILVFRMGLKLIWFHVELHLFMTSKIIICNPNLFFFDNNNCTFDNNNNNNYD